VTDLPSLPPPRVSVLLLAYQQARYVPESAAAVLAQEGGPYEVVMSDDASTDGTWEALCRVAEAYRGPHHVVLRRNPRNLGIGGHYNALLEAASGELLFTAAADDVSLPDRVARSVAAWEAHGRRPDLIAGHLLDLGLDDQVHGEIRVDDLAAWHGPQDWTRRRPYIVGAAHAFTRRLFERFGPLHEGLAYEDQILVFRALSSGGAITVDSPLVRYRRGGTSSRPRFEDAAQLRAWTLRRITRQQVELENLLADARIAGCESLVASHVADDRRRVRYQLDLLTAPDATARWALARAADELPLGWRLRKAAHLQWPGLTLGIRQAMAAVRGR
jgi:glycosyltransferase involved in cell wall biosynthesis